MKLSWHIPLSSWVHSSVEGSHLRGITIEEVSNFIKCVVQRYNLEFPKVLAGRTIRRIVAGHAIKAGNIISTKVLASPGVFRFSSSVVGQYGFDSSKLGAARVREEGNVNILLGSHEADPRV